MRLSGGCHHDSHAALLRLSCGSRAALVRLSCGSHAANVNFGFLFCLDYYCSSHNHVLPYTYSFSLTPPPRPSMALPPRIHFLVCSLPPHLLLLSVYLPVLLHYHMTKSFLTYTTTSELSISRVCSSLPPPYPSPSVLTLHCHQSAPDTWS